MPLTESQEPSGWTLGATLQVLTDGMRQDTHEGTQHREGTESGRTQDNARAG